jgi:hypothetical protein
VPNRIESTPIKALLSASPLIASWHVLTEDEATHRALYKIRCQLRRPPYQLEVRLIQTEEALLYAYQLFTDHPLLRWDNAPHFPTLSNFPHHFHDATGSVKPSSLTGDPLQDLPFVLEEVGAFMTRASS